MNFEFQRELRDDKWELVGTARTPGDRFDIEEAALRLRDEQDGNLLMGRYRVCAIDLDETVWLLQKSTSTASSSGSRNSRSARSEETGSKRSGP